MKYLLIGLGNIGTKRRALLGDRCVATVDSYNPKADSRDLRDILVTSYDSVILSVPNQAKLELLRLCLQLKKNVLVEKPLLFPDESTAQEFLKLSQDQDVIWYTSYNHRFEPLIEEVKKEIDSGNLGKIYHGHLYYGNGTVANVAGSWREEGGGVLEDLGCHLLDLTGYLLGYVGKGVLAWNLARHEARTFDYCLLATQDKRFILETSFLSWKNHFEIKLYGEKGSLHLQGLCKWGPTTLTIYDRVFPSGVPEERRKSADGPDVTWAKDLDHFEMLIQQRKCSFNNDLWISRTLNQFS